MTKLAGSIVSGKNSASKEMQIKSLRKNLNKSLEDTKLSKTTFLNEKASNLRFSISANETVVRKPEVAALVRPTASKNESSATSSSSSQQKANALSLLSSVYDDDSSSKGSDD